MIKRTIETFEVVHSGDDDDRLEILNLVARMSLLAQEGVEVTAASIKTDIIQVTVDVMHSE